MSEQFSEIIVEPCGCRHEIQLTKGMNGYRHAFTIFCKDHTPDPRKFYLDYYLPNDIEKPPA